MLTDESHPSALRNDRVGAPFFPRCAPADPSLPPGGAKAYVLAERAGGGNGRVYTIYFTATDGRGGSCSGSVKVSVPHDQNRPAVDDGPGYDSTVCSGNKGPKKCD